MKVFFERMGCLYNLGSFSMNFWELFWILIWNLNNSLKISRDLFNLIGFSKLMGILFISIYQHIVYNLNSLILKIILTFVFNQSHVFGPWLDVHSGGIDLLYPHHENEEAQCCAYHEKKQWVGHWIHSSNPKSFDNILGNLFLLVNT